MKKEKFDWKAAYEREEQITARFREMSEALEQDEQREDYTDAEKNEIKDLNRELSILRGKMMANTKTAILRSMEEAEDINAQMRETLKEGKRFELTIKRDAGAIGTVTNATNGLVGVLSGSGSSADALQSVALTTQDIVKPLYPRTIMALLGIPFKTGLEGDHQWPVVENVEATLEDEGVALGDTQIPISLLKSHPKRIGITIPVTNQAINKTAGLIQGIIRENMPEAILQMMNKVIFSATAVSQSVSIAGPFVSPKSGHSLTAAAAVPTYLELMNMVGVVAGENVIFDGTEAFVMPANMYYTLKATPRAAGQMGFIIDDNGRIGGIPVYICPWIGTGKIGFGVWKYNPAALFGDFRLVVDPYTGATKDIVRFTLNVDFDTTVLRKEAFALMGVTTT